MINTGIENYDFMLKKTKELEDVIKELKGQLEFMQDEIDTVTSIVDPLTTELDEMHTNLEQSKTAVEGKDHKNANTLLTGILADLPDKKTKLGNAKERAAKAKEKLEEAKTVMGRTEIILSDVGPTITNAIVATTANGKYEYTYKCVGCSIGCFKILKFIPLNDKTLKTCELDGRQTADFLQIDMKVFRS